MAIGKDKMFESLYRFEYEKEHSDVGKDCFSDPNNTISTLDTDLNPNEYDEIDFIEDLLTSHAKDVMSLKGYSLRSDIRKGNVDIVADKEQISGFETKEADENDQHEVKDKFIGESKISSIKCQDKVKCRERIYTTSQDKKHEIVSAPMNSSKITHLDDAIKVTYEEEATMTNKDDNRHVNQDENPVYRGDVEFSIVTHDSNQIAEISEENSKIPVETEDTRINIQKKEPFAFLNGGIFNVENKNVIKCPVAKYKLIEGQFTPHVGENVYLPPEEANLSIKKTPSKQYHKYSDILITKLDKNKALSISENLETIENSDIRKFYLETGSKNKSVRLHSSMGSLSQSNILGKLEMNDNGVGYVNHWFLIVGPNLTCYNQEKQAITPSNTPNEISGDIIHPKKTGFFLTRKYVINICDSKIFILQNTSRINGRFINCICSPAVGQKAPELIDITQASSIDVERKGREYAYTVSTGCGERVITNTSLEFVLENNGRHVYFKSDDIEMFNLWLKYFPRKHNRNPHNTGRE